MKIFRSLDEARGRFGPSAITIGNFDGVHAGHRALMSQVKRLASELALQPSVVTFHPHPTMIVAPERAPKLLTTPEERVALMAAEGIHQVLILPFDLALSQESPETFFHSVLRDALDARAICVGGNFHFGRGQAGSTSSLERMGAETGVRVEILSELRIRGVLVSSSAIRRLLSTGRVSMAARLLERPYALSGSVVGGEGRGRRETVPTLNLDTRSLDGQWQALPANGVYITRTADLATQRGWPSITNIGSRPTFEGKNLTVETYLLEPLEGPAPERIRVEFLRYVRPERQFPGAPELKAQILRDVQRAQAYFRRVRSVTARPA